MTATDDKAAALVQVSARELAALRRRITAVLIASQILGGLGVATGIALAAVLAQEVSGTEALSGLAPTATVAGTALLSMPLAALMTARGRRPGLVLAYLIGALGAGVVVLAAVAVSHTAMVSIMSMTPVALSHHGADIQLIGLVISGHIAGMYAFSPLMGWLADRIGRLMVIGLAAGLLSVAALLAGTAGASHGQTAAGLFVLGLGWSAGLVAGSTLLTDSVPQPARAAVQGLSDLTMNTAAGIGGVAAGLIVAQASYGWLNLIGACLLLPLAALTVRRALS